MHFFPDLPLMPLKKAQVGCYALTITCHRNCCPDRNQVRTPDPFFVKTGRCGRSNGWRPRLRATCKQTGYEDAPGARGTSSIAGAMLDWFDAINAGPDPRGVLEFEAAGDRGD
jgi:hypothetical protein